MAAATAAMQASSRTLHTNGLNVIHINYVPLSFLPSSDSFHIRITVVECSCTRAVRFTSQPPRGANCNCNVSWCGHYYVRVAFFIATVTGLSRQPAGQQTIGEESVLTPFVFVSSIPCVDCLL